MLRDLRGPDFRQVQARQVGVSATAAYRHFAGHGELIQAVKEQAQGALARWMQAELEATPSQDDPAEDALRRMRAIGVGYVRFALSEPGLFRTAFCHTENTRADHPPAASFRSYQLLGEVLDDLVRCGRMPAHRREYAPGGGLVGGAWPGAAPAGRPTVEHPQGAERGAGPVRPGHGP
jgi:AcrR family transcriptional regulator